MDIETPGYDMVQLRIYKPIREHHFYPNNNKKPEKKN